jgi:GDP-L-fucose synthase
MANTTRRAEFIHDNLMITANVIHQSWLSGVKKLLNLGSTCIYPRDCPQPMQEEHLLTAPLEYTNEPYAIAKIAGLKLCESYNLQYGTNFLSVMPTNLYGPGDNFDLETAHVLPALMRRMHLAKCLEQKDWDAIQADLNKRPIDGVDGSAHGEAILEVLQKHGVSCSQTTDHRSLTTVRIWGTGSPRREFLYSQDMAEACLFIMENVDFQDLARGKQEVRNTHMNIGSTEEISIRDLACKVKQAVGFQGQLEYDPSKPDGTPRKLTDSSKLHALGWKHSTSLDQGLEKLYAWYQHGQE